LDGDGQNELNWSIGMILRMVEESADCGQLQSEDMCKSGLLNRIQSFGVVGWMKVFVGSRIDSLSVSVFEPANLDQLRLASSDTARFS
jgi:hypothetical protein